MQYCTVRYSIVKYPTVKYSALKYFKSHYISEQYNAKQLSIYRELQYSKVHTVHTENKETPKHQSNTQILFLFLQID